MCETKPNHAKDRSRQSPLGYSNAKATLNMIAGPHFRDLRLDLQIISNAQDLDLKKGKCKEHLWHEKSGLLYYTSGLMRFRALPLE